jgi:hypothetical protein
MTPASPQPNDRPLPNPGEYPSVSTTLAAALAEGAKILRDNGHVNAMIVARRPLTAERFEFLAIGEHCWPQQLENVGWERIYRLTR